MSRRLKGQRIFVTEAGCGLGAEKAAQSGSVPAGDVDEATAHLFLIRAYMAWRRK